MEKVKIKATIISNSVTEKDIDDLNSQSLDCQYSLTKHRGFAMPPEVVMIVIELLQNVGYNATYDLIKTSVLSIVSKISSASKKETRVVVIKGNQKSEIRLSFDVTEEQMDKLVDAAIEQWRK